MVGLNRSRLNPELGNGPTGPEILADLGEDLAEFAGSIKASLFSIQDQLNVINSSILEGARYDDAQNEAIIRRVNVSTAGTPVNGPNIPVPRGFTTVIRQRRHTGTPNGYIALNEHSVGSTDFRIELQDNDSISLKVTNWDEIWFDADTANTAFELIVEQ